jgi:hypothetical protein
MEDVYRQTLTLLSHWTLASQAVVIAEHEKKFDPGDDAGQLHRVRRLEQGDAALSFYRRVS